MAHWTKILADETVIKKTVLFDGRVAGNVVSFEQECEREVGYWIGREPRRRSRSSLLTRRCAAPSTRR